MTYAQRRRIWLIVGLNLKIETCRINGDCWLQEAFEKELAFWPPSEGR